ncbi:hypothetical protein [Methylobacterium sp. sgz302541]|uniref:hypothetical protein n=1 Tax=unclassified Methylobacterium TaxID=2615210 RepID=UPI003D33C3CE
MNFLLGLVAGALIAAIATIAAARDPGVQTALGLRPAAPLPMTAPAPTRPEKPCVAATPVPPGVGSPDMLLSRRRFWSVAP